MLLPARACVGAVLNRDTFIAASVKLSASHNHVPGSYMVVIIMLILVPMRHVATSALAYDSYEPNFRVRGRGGVGLCRLECALGLLGPGGRV